MAYLIYTDRENLLKSFQSSLVRIPCHLKKYFDFGQIRKGDLIFFYDFENSKVYGPVFLRDQTVFREKNPKNGPFNGFGNVYQHYHYESIPIDCSKMFKRGVFSKEFTLKQKRVCFYLSEKDETEIIDKLRQINQECRPLIINLMIGYETLNATVVRVSRGTCIKNYSFQLNKTLFPLLKNKKRQGETFLRNGKDGDFISTLKEIGSVIYESILRNLELEELFSKGGYTVYLSADRRARNIPFEISYKNLFIFEKNIVSWRCEEQFPAERTPVRNILVVADPTGNYKWAYNEGSLLYQFFHQAGFSVDFISRSITKEMLSEFFSHYDIVHFSGHSGRQGSGTGWDIGTALFSAGDVLNTTKVPFLVFSSGCGDALTLGSKFLRLGVKNIISSRWWVPDRDISDFIMMFYSLLFENLEIGLAFNRALFLSYRKGCVLPLIFGLHGESRLVYEKRNP